MEKGGLSSLFGRKIKLYPHSVVLLPAITVQFFSVCKKFLFNLSANPKFI
jgi:hypothetical protein